MKDFSVGAYRKLAQSIQGGGYGFQTLSNFIERPEDRTVILRHDVDLLPSNALQMGRMEHGLGVVGTYYFRAVRESWDEGVIREFVSLGHEVGYHYENLSSVVRSRGSVVRDRGSE